MNERFVQLNISLPKWRKEQIIRRADINNKSMKEYLCSLVDQEESVAKGKTIIVTNPNRDLTLREVVNG